MPSNDHLVHGLTRGGGPSGGLWPANWKPANLGSPAQARSPIVPLAGGSRAFYSTFDGWVHAVDAKTGVILWETKIGTGPQTGAGGAPAGIFTAFGGAVGLHPRGYPPGVEQPVLRPQPHERGGDRLLPRGRGRSRGRDGRGDRDGGGGLRQRPGLLRDALRGRELALVPQAGPALGRAAVRGVGGAPGDDRGRRRQPGHPQREGLRRNERGAPVVRQRHERPRPVQPHAERGVRADQGLPVPRPRQQRLVLQHEPRASTRRSTTESATSSRSGRRRPASPARPPCCTGRPRTVSTSA